MYGDPTFRYRDIVARWFASLVLALALGVTGCSETAGTGGSGRGSAGVGGAGGMGGDDCQGRSCVPTGITQEDGLSGVDNAFAGMGPVIAGVGGDLRGFNQALSDSLCGRRDDVERGDCLLETLPYEIRFLVDANANEDCVNVTVLADDEASAHVLNLNDDGCASGTLGTIPIAIRGEEGSLENTVVRMTVSPAGFSHGLLGAVMDASTAYLARESLGVTAAADWPVLDIDASTPPVRDASADCNGLSVTLVIGGIAQIASP